MDKEFIMKEVNLLMRFLSADTLLQIVDAREDVEGELGLEIGRWDFVIRGRGKLRRRKCMCVKERKR